MGATTIDKPPQAEMIIPELEVGDTCDRCGPGVDANTAVLLRSGGKLTFCNHCYDRFEAAMAAVMGAVSRRQVK